MGIGMKTRIQKSLRRNKEIYPKLHLGETLKLQGQPKGTPISRGQCMWLGPGALWLEIFPLSQLEDFQMKQYFCGNKI